METLISMVDTQEKLELYPESQEAMRESRLMLTQRAVLFGHVTGVLT